MPRRERRDDVSTRPEPLRPIAEISVTPPLGGLIVLVLGYLATLADPHRAIDVHLPVAPEDVSTSYNSPCSGEQVVLTVYADGQCDVNKQVVPREALEQRLRAVYRYRGCAWCAISACVRRVGSRFTAASRRDSRVTLDSRVTGAPAVA
jgi:biopolymer transport protein ExbD